MSTTTTSSTPTRSAGSVEARVPRRSSPELGLIASLWWRDLLRLFRERSRWFGVVLQPLIFWGLIGSGMADSFTLNGHEEMSYLSYFYPGVLVMVVLFTTIFATMSVIEDRQSGFLQGVLVAPASTGALVIGKVAGVTTMALIEVAIFLALAPAAGFALGDIAWGPLLLVVVLASVGLTAMNLSVAWVMRSAAAYHGVMSVVLLPLWVLSGAMFPPSEALGGVMLANPMSYAVDGARAAVAGAEQSGLVGVGMWTSIAVLAGFAVVMVALATRVCGRGRGGH